MSILTRALLIGYLPCTLALAASWEDAFFDSAGVAIRYVTGGAGEPVVLLHGYTSNVEEQWIEPGVFAVLARHYRVIAFDARGHGRSGKPHDPDRYGAEMGRDVVRLLDHLGIERAHIVGYSMGAHIVAQLLTLHPERFRTATLGGAAGRRGWSAADDRRIEQESAEMERGLMTTQILRLTPPGEPPPDEEELKARSARILAGRDPRALAAVRRSNRDQVVTDAALAAVQVPTLGIVGSNDPYRADFEALRRILPRLELTVIEGATHATAAVHPAFVQALRAFIERAGARPATSGMEEPTPLFGALAT